MNDDARARHARGAGALSEAGRRRRAALREDVLAAGRSRRRRRAGARMAAAAAVVAIAVPLLVTDRHGPETRPPPAPVARHDGPAALTLEHADFAVVATTPEALRRWIAPSRDPEPEVFVGDDELLRLLVAAERPTGLVRTPDRVIVTRDVFDRLE